MSSAADYYKEKMSRYVHSSNLPPTCWELGQKHTEVSSEANSRFGSSSDVSRNKMTKAYREVQKDFKERRHQMLIEAVLGTKNYVPQIN